MAPRLKWKRSGSQKKKRKKNDAVGGIRIQYTGRKFGRNLYSTKKIRNFPQGFDLPALTQWQQKILGHDKSMVSLDVWENSLAPVLCEFENSSEGHAATKARTD